MKILLKSFTNSLFQTGTKFITLLLLFFTIDISALKIKKLKINPMIELLTNIILEKIFLRLNSTEAYSDFEEKEENPKKETLGLEEQKD